MSEEWYEVKFSNKIKREKVEDAIKVRAWDIMYNQHHEKNWEWEHYPESAYEIIQLMDTMYNQAERIEKVSEKLKLPFDNDDR